MKFVWIKFIVLLFTLCASRELRAYDCTRVMARISKPRPTDSHGEFEFRTKISPKIELALKKFQKGDLQALEMLISELNAPHVKSEWIDRLNLPWDEIILMLRHGSQIPNAEDRLEHRLSLLAQIRNLFIERSSSEDVERLGNWIKWHLYALRLRMDDRAKMGRESVTALNAQAGFNAVFNRNFASGHQATEAVIKAERAILKIPFGDAYVRLQALKRLSPKGGLSKEHQAYLRVVSRTADRLPEIWRTLEGLEDQVLQKGYISKNAIAQIDGMATSIDQLAEALKPITSELFDEHWKSGFSNAELEEAEEQVVAELIDEAIRAARRNNPQRLTEILSLRQFSSDEILTDSGHSILDLPAPEPIRRVLEQFRQDGDD